MEELHPDHSHLIGGTFSGEALSLFGLQSCSQKNITLAILSLAAASNASAANSQSMPPKIALQ
jgi:hypothetical protein